MTNRKHLLLSFALLVAFAACRKTDNSGNGCITRQVWKVSDVVLSQADQDTAVMLFTANHIPLETFQPITAFNYGPDSTGRFSHAYYSRPYVNGLPFNEGSRYYSFYNGKLTDTPLAFLYSPENSDTTTTLDLNTIQRLFLDSKPDTYSSTGSFFKRVTHWRDSCIVAVLSYTEKNRVDPNSPSSLLLSKVWGIYGSGNLTTPIAYITDPGQVAVPIHYFSFY